MRFIENGPLIPDELLTARDEGRVVFFCGAGISLHRAGLDDFFGLADSVVDSLGVPAEDRIRAVLKKIKTIDDETGVGGLISADSVFGILERDFPRKDVEESVAKALKPNGDVDLWAHRVMIDLATTPDGKVRLVTSNFDLLFEDCDSSLTSSIPPKLPDPDRAVEFEGIIHLHGKVDEGYNCAEGDGFVLSSTEFGRAYLADGWATRFIRSVLNKYVVVFVGYTADDPPVKYLLEGLNRQSDSQSTIYAFQQGSVGEAEAKWAHKGVNPIPFDDFNVLWDTLEAWGKRAKDLDLWYEDVFTLADKGPEHLSRHQRGQIGHIVSTVEGARKLASREVPIPAEWLCVFDSSIRFSQPGNLGGIMSKGDWIDPFEIYGLDDDLVPFKIGPDDRNTKREIPPNSWNAFSLNQQDMATISTSNTSSLFNINSVQIQGLPTLPTRLDKLANWLVKVADQPAAIWWAAKKINLDSRVKLRIKNELDSNNKDVCEFVRKAWTYLFEAWEFSRDPHQMEWFSLKSTVDKFGWSPTAVREFGRVTRPYIQVKTPWRQLKPPVAREVLSLDMLINLDVEYPTIDDDAKIPSEHLALIVGELRRSLSVGVVLENEIGGYGLYHVASIDTLVNNEQGYRDTGLSHLIGLLAKYFRQLAAVNMELARAEFFAWGMNDDSIFSKLKVWVAGESNVLNSSEASEALSRIPDSEFWDPDSQSDLLKALNKRWAEFTWVQQHYIQQKIVAGPENTKGESKDKHQARAAMRSLERLIWLKNNECSFSLNFDFDKEVAKLRLLAPEWEDSFAAKAVDSDGLRVAEFVRLETDYTELEDLPVEQVLAKAAELRGGNDDFMVDIDPFQGLVDNNSEKALEALKCQAGQEECYEWAWRTFLYSEKRKDDEPAFISKVAELLGALPVEKVSVIIHVYSSWVETFSSSLFDISSEQFYSLWSLLIRVFEAKAETLTIPTLKSGDTRDWVSEAINSPVGKLTHAVMVDPVKADMKIGEGLPTEWLEKLEKLISLSDYSIVIISRQLRWFYNIDPTWTKKNILCCLKDKQKKDAVWNGLFWNANVPQPPLYIELKEDLLSLVKANSLTRKNHSNILAGFLLGGWVNSRADTSEKLVSNEEMRDLLLAVDDGFRCQVIGNFERWLIGKNGTLDQDLVRLTPEFFKVVWPKQIIAKSSLVSARLCEFSLSVLNIVPDLTRYILPLLGRSDQANMRSLHLLGRELKNIKEFPEDALKLLYTILPVGTENWPYATDRALTAIGEANTELLKDPMLIELSRRWNAR